MILRNKNIRKRLLILAVVFVAAFILEYLAFVLLNERPFLQFKVQMVIGVVLIAYLIHAAYKIWFLANNPFHENGLNE